MYETEIYREESAQDICTGYVVLGMCTLWYARDGQLHQAYIERQASSKKSDVYLNSSTMSQEI